METLSKTISSVGDMISKKQSASAESAPSASLDDLDVWAKLVAAKARKMEEMRAEEFKLKVDTLALEYLKADHD